MMRSVRQALVLAIVGLIGLPAYGAEIVPVGAAKLDVTPDYAIRLSGYSSRRVPSQGVADRIWAKALVIGGDEGEGPAALVTVDNCGVTIASAQRVRGRLEELGLSSPRIAICSSHSHTAPWLIGFAPFLAQDEIPADQQQTRERYTREIEDAIVKVVRDALRQRRPASLYWGQGRVSFAANRRVLRDGIWAGFGVQADGPVDHRLPILVAKDQDGAPLAIWANYACHCTTLGGNFNQISGDWSGYAQTYLEAEYPSAISLVSIGCGADANPEPRGELEYAKQHGRALADEVKRLMEGELTSLPTNIECRMKWIKLPFDTIPDRAAWEQMAQGSGSRGMYAKHFLGMLQRGESLPTTLDYGLASWTFGDQLAMFFMSGEVVVDFAMRINDEFAGERVWVVAYANDVPCYITSKRILREGGYEADGSMIYYGRPTRLAPEAEEIIFKTLHELLPENFAP
jgi:hypothetical protein